MPGLAMAEPVLDHQKRFQAAVDVIHNLPKNGSYRPSYEVMLRFYSLYKQAVCGPCTVARPGFWDPVGRYKWDAWSRLGQMSSESAMAAYVDQMKNVAQEVIDSTPMNEKTASLFHHFEPLYLVIEDMPRPPQALITLTEGVKGSDDDEGLTQREEEEQADSIEESCVPEDPDPELNLFEVIDLTANTNGMGTSSVFQDQGIAMTLTLKDSGVCDGVVVTSDSESEIFCDSVDSVEQLSSIKVAVGQSNGFHNGHVTTSSPCPPQQQASGLEGPLEARQVGAGQGGEGADHTKGPRRDRDTGRGGSHNWRERGVPQGGVRRGPPGGGGGGDGRGGADGSENSPDRGQDVRLQQQIILALRRLREDMRSVMDRLEVVERLAATHSQSLEWRPCLQCAASASQQQEEGWWPFDVSGQTVLLFLLWPFVAQGLVSVLRKAAHRRNRMAS